MWALSVMLLPPPLPQLTHIPPPLESHFPRRNVTASMPMRTGTLMLVLVSELPPTATVVMAASQTVIAATQARNRSQKTPSLSVDVYQVETVNTTHPILFAIGSREALPRIYSAIMTRTRTKTRIIST